MKRSNLALLLFVLFVSTRASAELVAWWSFSTNATYGVAVDARSGLPLRMRGGATISPDGTGFSSTPGDRAARFGTGNQRLHLTDASFLTQHLAGNAFSASFWIRQNTERQSTSISMVSPAIPGGRLFQAHTPWDNDTVYFDTGGCCDARHRIQVATNVIWSTWHHIALVKNGDEKTIYLDGNPIATGVNTARVDVAVTQLFLGNGPSTIEAVDGEMDEVSLFGRALTPAEVSQLFAGSSPLNLAIATLDFDFDGLPDFWEERFSPGDLTQLNAAPADYDNDGFNDAAEFLRGWNPAVAEADSDNDGLLDVVETGTGTYVSPFDTGTNPNLEDSDGDTLLDGFEVNTRGTDPNRGDTDSDGLSDGVESNTGVYVSPSDTGSSPFVANTDGDAYSDLQEVRYGSDPTDNGSLPFTGDERFLLALWDYNNAAVPARADDVIVGYPGVNNGVYTADGGGRSGQPGDRAMQYTNQRTLVDGSFIRNVAAANAVTISWWQKLNAQTASSAFWVDSPSSSGSRGLHAHVPWSEGNVYFDHSGCCDNGVTRISGPLNVSPLSDWHHILLLKNGNTKQIWINGQLRVNGTGTAPLASDFGNLYIGSANGSQYINGVMDDFAIFAGGLNVEQIARLSLGESPRTVLTDSPIQITVTHLGGTSLQLDFPTIPGMIYRLESRPDLLSGDWTDIGLDFPSGGTTTSISLTLPPWITREHLRVRVKGR